MYNCDCVICPGFQVLFLCATAHKFGNFEKFVFELEAVSCDFKTGCSMV